MPGSISDSYDCEWGTAANGQDIANALDGVYKSISNILGNKPPMFILDLVRLHDGSTCQTLNTRSAITATLSEYQWRIIRFALERAKESL